MLGFAVFGGAAALVAAIALGLGLCVFGVVASSATTSSLWRLVVGRDEGHFFVGVVEVDFLADFFAAFFRVSVDLRARDWLASLRELPPAFFPVPDFLPGEFL